MRLFYLDIIRGFAVILMVVFQTIDAFKLIDLYGVPQLYVLSRCWTFMFWLVAGFSCMLMKKKYPPKKFWLKVGWRFLKFSAVGWFLMLLVPFNIPEPWLNEAVASIGLNLIFLSFIVALNRIEIFVASLGVLIALNWLVKLNVLFSPFEVLSFMLIGAILAMKPSDIQIRFRPLEFLGRHALLFYVGHFLIISVITRIV